MVTIKYALNQQLNSFVAMFLKATRSSIAKIDSGNLGAMYRVSIVLVRGSLEVWAVAVKKCWASSFGSEMWM